jgi:hypothetical protein
MDEVSSHVCLNLPFKLTTRPRERLFYLVLESHDGRAPGADSEEKREPVSDIDIAVADSLRVLDLKRPIREADIGWPVDDRWSAKKCRGHKAPPILLVWYPVH